MNIKTICIYCGSAEGKDPVYQDIARQLGALCAEKDLRIVYGGAHVGLMGMVADSALEKGGEVVGVIPKDLQKREVAHRELTELHVTDTMHERQMMMAKLSDAFLILPGGIGTLAEFFEILTWRSLNFHDKPIYLLNLGGYWSALLDTLENAEDKGFLHSAHKDLVKIVNDISDIELFQEE